MTSNGNHLIGIRKPRIFTVGHSDRSIEGLIHLLESSSIKMVVDVRSNPASVRFPHFERTALANALDTAGIFYRWFRILGGNKIASPEDNIHSALPESLRSYAVSMNSEAFHEAVEELVGLSASTGTAVLCAENNPRECHRYLLADKIQQLGARVVHIVDQNTAFDHESIFDFELENGKLFYRSKQMSFL